DGKQTTGAAELHVKRGTVLRSLGRMPDAIAAFEQALDLFKVSDDANRFGEPCLILAQTFWRMVRLDKASEVCRPGLEALGPVEARARLVLMGALGGILGLANVLDSALPLLGVLQQISISQHPALVQPVARFQTYVYFIWARLERAHQTACETQRLCQAAGD